MKSSRHVSGRSSRVKSTNDELLRLLPHPEDGTAVTLGFPRIHGHSPKVAWVLFELIRAHLSERRMPTSRIVEPLNVVEHSDKRYSSSCLEQQTPALARIKKEGPPQGDKDGPRGGGDLSIVR